MVPPNSYRAERMSYAVVQERFETIDPECLIKILREQGGMTRTDAARVARREQGILWERFEFQQAERVVAALAQHDYATRVVPVENIPKLHKPHSIHWVEFGDESLGIPLGLDQQVVSVLWTSVFVVSAGEVSEVVSKLVTTNVRYDSQGEAVPTDDEIQRESRLVPVTDLISIADDGQFLHVRLAANQLAYDRILGPQTGLTAYQKYLAVVDELVARSTFAIISPKTRRMLVERKESYSTARHADWAALDQIAFEKYNRWMLQLVMFKERQQEDQAWPSSE